LTILELEYLVISTFNLLEATPPCPPEGAASQYSASACGAYSVPAQ